MSLDVDAVAFKDRTVEPRFPVKRATFTAGSMIFHCSKAVLSKS